MGESKNKLNEGLRFVSNIIEMYNEQKFTYTLSHQRLQRLIFLFYLHYLDKYKKHFLDVEFEAFKLGGVVKDIYGVFKYQGNHIKRPAKYLTFDKNGFIEKEYDKLPLTEEEQSFLLEVLKKYDSYNESLLADICIQLMKLEQIKTYDIITKKQLENMSRRLDKAII